MKNTLIALLIGAIPISTIASMDYNDALNSHNSEYRHLGQGISNSQSYNDYIHNTGTPNSSTPSVKMSSWTHHLNPPNGSIQTVSLAHTSTYTCAISRIGGYYSRGLKGFDAQVYKSGSYWYLRVGKDCGGCDNWAEAVCWTIQ